MVWRAEKRIADGSGVDCIGCGSERLLKHMHQRITVRGVLMVHVSTKSSRLLAVVNHQLRHSRAE
jgi:hypothetical protein